MESNAAIMGSGTCMAVPCASWRSSLRRHAVLQQSLLRRLSSALPQTSPLKNTRREWTVRDGAAPRATADEDALAYTTRVALTRKIDSGVLHIKPLARDDINDTASLLTRAFLNVAESISSRDAKEFCMKALLSPPQAVMLVAHLMPFDRSELGPDRAQRVVGLTHVSFSPDSRPIFHAAQPPDAAAYISSMAVDARYRRQGIARLLIEASEMLCFARNIELLCLHAWSNDPIAQSCYRSCDFHTVKQPALSNLSLWKPVRTRLLMLKELERKE